MEDFSSFKKQSSVENSYGQKSSFGKGKLRDSGDFKNLVHAREMKKDVLHP